jgi:RHS repeat-associated protein
VDNIFGFSGYIYTPSTKLYCLRLRWYSTEMGRFIQRDPLGYVDGMNLYQYVEGMPITSMDPLGLSSVRDSIHEKGLRRPTPSVPRRAPGSSGDWASRAVGSPDELARMYAWATTRDRSVFSPEHYGAERTRNQAEYQRIKGELHELGADIAEEIVWEAIYSLAGGTIISIGGRTFRIVKKSGETILAVP